MLNEVLLHVLSVLAVYQVADLVGRLHAWLRWRWSW